MPASPLRPWHAVYPNNVSPRVNVPAVRLYDFVAKAAQERPSADALVWIDEFGARQAWTYRELWARCEQTASWLASNNICQRIDISQTADLDPANPPEHQAPPRVLLWLPNVPAFVIAYYGAMLAGCIVTAASPALKPEELAAQLADAAPRLALVLKEDADTARQALALTKLASCRIEVISNTGNLPPSTNLPQAIHPAPSATHHQLAREVAVLQYTSGTTGAAKGAVMTQRNLVANAIQNAEWFGWADDAHTIVNLAVLPLCHTWGMCCCLNSTMYVGGTLVLADQRKGFDPDATCTMVESHRATVLYGSATMFHRLLDVQSTAADRRQAQLATLRHVKAGAMLSQGNLRGRWDTFCPNAPLRQGYGLTEASPESHNNPPDAFRAGTVGVPIQSTDCRICDPSDPNKILNLGEAGEVQLAGPQITLGYWRRPQATLAAFAPVVEMGASADFDEASGDFSRDLGGTPRWLRTGDIGVMDADGYLSIVDRMKDLLKFRGYSISPNAIEDCLLRHPMVREAVVVGRNDDRDGEVPTAFVVLRDALNDAVSPAIAARPMAAGEVAATPHATAMHQSSLTVDRVELASDIESSLRAHCEAHLASYERPRAYVALAAIPKNHVAKPLRRVLRDWVNADAGR